MTMRVDDQLPGGNVRVLSVDGREAVLAPDLRDTNGHWFYWCFRALFEADDGEYTFRVGGPGAPALGPRGPAVSEDRGVTWRVLSPGQYDVETETFRYTPPAGVDETWFCLAVPYRPEHFAAFADAHADDPAWHRDVLCRTRRGRPVEVVRVADGDAARPKVLLTARHHCCEMTAGYVMEGLLAYALALANAGARRAMTIHAVPFVDLDGVVDGDQGKNRAPHDHNRDYGPVPIYPETAAVMDLARREHFDAAFDLHCPWLRGGQQETIFWVGPRVPAIAAEVARLARIMESMNDTDLPFEAERDVCPFGTDWNLARDDRNGTTCARWMGDRPGMRLAATLEFPYANVRDATLSPALARAWGGVLGRALTEYFRS